MSNTYDQTKNRRSDATTAHKSSVKDGRVRAARIAIPIFAALIAITLAMANVGFFWLLVTAGVIFVLGMGLSSDNLKGEMKEWLWFYPSLLKPLAIGIAVVTLLTSGPGMLFAKSVNSSERAARCEATNYAADGCEKPQPQVRRTNYQTAALAPVVREKPKPEPIIGDCDPEFATESVFCKKVILASAGEPFTLPAPKGQCLYHVPYAGVVRKEPAPSTYAYSTVLSEQSVHIFTVSVGETYDGVTCGAESR